METLLIGLGISLGLGVARWFVKRTKTDIDDKIVDAIAPAVEAELKKRGNCNSRE